MAIVEPTQPRTKSPRRISGSESQHEAAFQFVSSRLGVDRDQFNQSLNDPHFRVDDRLLIKQAGQIVGHAILTRRTVKLGVSELTFRGLRWFASVNSDVSRRLYDWAMHKSREQGAALLVIQALHDESTAHDQNAVWTRIGSPIWSQCFAKNLPAWSYSPSKTAQPEIIVQPWRHDQLNSLRSIYDATRDSHSPQMDRSESYWTWLVRNDESKQVWVGYHSDKPVGYAVLKGTSILELASSREDILEAILSRIRMEAMDRNQRFVTLHAPESHAGHQLFYEAAGIMAGDPACHYYGTIVDFHLLLETMLKELGERRSLPRIPCELGIVLNKGGSCTMTFDGDNRGLIHKGRRGRSHLQMSPATLLNLIFGKSTPSELIVAGDVQASTQLAIEVADELFRPTPFYVSPFDQGSL